MSMLLSWWSLGTALVCVAQSTSDFQASVNLVAVTSTVTGKDGRPVTDMRAEEFLLLEDGRPQPLRYLWREVDLPLTIGLIVDVSGTQAPVIVQHRRTIARFLEQVIRPQDQAFLVAVG